MDTFIINPKTGKPIKRGGTTHKQLFKSGDISEALPPPRRRVLTEEQLEKSKVNLQKGREVARQKREDLKASRLIKDEKVEKPVSPNKLDEKEAEKI